MNILMLVATWNMLGLWVLMLVLALRKTLGG